MTNSFYQGVSLTEVEQFIKDAKTEDWSNSSKPDPFIMTGQHILHILSSTECVSAVPAVVWYAGYLYLKVKDRQLSYNRRCNNYLYSTSDEEYKDIFQKVVCFEKALELDSSYLQDKDALKEVGCIRLEIYEGVYEPHYKSGNPVDWKKSVNWIEKYVGDDYESAVKIANYYQEQLKFLVKGTRNTWFGQIFTHELTSHDKELFEERIRYWFHKALEFAEKFPTQELVYNALLTLGDLYKYGYGVKCGITFSNKEVFDRKTFGKPIDLVKAHKYYMAAYIISSVSDAYDAASEVYFDYAYGKGVEKDRKKAEEFFEGFKARCHIRDTDRRARPGRSHWRSGKVFC